MPSQCRSASIDSAYSARDRSVSVSSKRSTKAPPARPGEEVVQQRRPGIADVDAPGGRRREADDGVRHARLMAEPAGRGNPCRVHRSAARRLCGCRATRCRERGERPQSSSTTSPSCSVTRRSMRAARSRLWVAISAARPVARTSAVSVAEDMVGGARVEIAGRLVGQQHARARWRPRARWRRAAARRRTVPPADGRRAGRGRDRSAVRAPRCRGLRAATGRGSSAACTTFSSAENSGSR